MKYIRKFESFLMADPATTPTKTPSPTTTPGKSPGKRPGKPSPIRKDKPGVRPAPKAEKKDLPKASVEDVINKYKELTNQ